jgi:hypothetical protein
MKIAPRIQSVAIPRRFQGSCRSFPGQSRSPNGVRTRVSTLRAWPGAVLRPAAKSESGR